MSSYREFVAYLPRPKSVDDWSDTTEVLERHVADLLATLDDGWSTEGPVNEADSLYMTSTRRRDDREHTIWFSFDYLAGAATMPRAVPDPMRFEVRVQEEERSAAPWISATPPPKEPTAFGVASAGSRGWPALGLGLAIGLTLGGLALAWRAAGWLMPSLALALALVGFVVARAAAPAWVGRGTQPRKRAGSPELLALAASVERYLRAAFTDVRLLDGDE
jgi:hypothetical protein